MDVNIRIAGAAGQGLQTTVDILGKTCLRSGCYAHLYQDAESRIRGGLNFSHIRVSEKPCMGICNDFDILVTQTDQALDKFAPSLAADGILMHARRVDRPHAVPFALDELSKQAGSQKVSGTVACASICALLGIDKNTLIQVIREYFENNQEILRLNEQAVELGYQAGSNLDVAYERFRISTTSGSSKRLWIAGHQAISLGALAGGVSFVSGYPMSPATSVLLNLAKWANEYDLIVEQAEDEIAAINMIAGASYAGGRAMTATSGGGFCLMTEGVSLLGMIEAPAVIVIGQRPGPSTGQPTRTAQGDLRLVLHAGQGFFPRIVLAPRDAVDCFNLTALAFDFAERYQVPVFVLSDALLMDSQAIVDDLETSHLPHRRHLLDGSELNQMKAYKRYALTESGISPLAAPGASEHVVVVDSDEHDENGHLTEAAEIADLMSKKRIKKAMTIENEVLLDPPLVEGPHKEVPLVISWGSTYHTVSEVRSRLSMDGGEFSHLHLRQLWPLPIELLQQTFQRFSSICVVENNPNAELADLLAQTTLIRPKHLITRSDGRPINVTELTEKLEKEVLACR